MMAAAVLVGGCGGKDAAEERHQRKMDYQLQLLDKGKLNPKANSLMLDVDGEAQIVYRGLEMDSVIARLGEPNEVKVLDESDMVFLTYDRWKLELYFHLDILSDWIRF